MQLQSPAPSTQPPSPISHEPRATLTSRIRPLTARIARSRRDLQKVSRNSCLKPQIRTISPNRRRIRSAAEPRGHFGPGTWSLLPPHRLRLCDLDQIYPFLLVRVFFLRHKLRHKCPNRSVRGFSLVYLKGFARGGALTVAISRPSPGSRPKAPHLMNHVPL